MSYDYWVKVEYEIFFDLSFRSKGLFGERVGSQF